MKWIAAAILAGITSFAATNIDDMVLSMLFFAQVNDTFRPRHIFLGKYLGFAALIAAIAVLRKVRYAQCPMPNALCPMPNALCPMPNAR